jgi:arsenate reductase
MKLLPQVALHVSSIRKQLPTKERQVILQQLIDHVVRTVREKKYVNLNFICTHNSRRSQYSQIWAQLAADFFELPISSYSGGVEVTAFNQRAVDSLGRMGFEITSEEVINPNYQVMYAVDQQGVLAFSKTYDDPVNPSDDYAAVVTCDHADQNCPVIEGASVRIPIRYDDPKSFDDTPLESDKYDERSKEIGAEMFYVMQNVSEQLQ